MRIFTKTFNLCNNQVLIFKNYVSPDESDDNVERFEITQRLSPEEGAFFDASIGFPTKEERDSAFETYKEIHARQFVSTMRECFNGALSEVIPAEEDENQTKLEFDESED